MNKLTNVEASRMLFVLDEVKDKLDLVGISCHFITSAHVFTQLAFMTPEAIDNEAIYDILGTAEKRIILQQV
jgi:hypothetical protein